MAEETTRRYWVEITTKGKKIPSNKEVMDALHWDFSNPRDQKSKFNIQSIKVGSPSELILGSGVKK